MRVDRARGAHINGMIDFTSGWLVANVGHDNPAVLRAVREAYGWAVIDGYENPHRVLAEREMRSILPPHLTELAFYNSGSEAMDAAVRFAGRPIRTMERAYHGSTIGAQALMRIGAHLDALNTEPREAVLLETFLGPWCEWLPDELITRLRTLQETRGMVVIFDEMQAGFGRTGRWWGFQHYRIEPDIVVGGKAMAGGFPMAFVATRAGMMSGPDNWESTFSGNALCCAACVATIQEIKRRRLLERVRALEPIIRDALPARGKGFAYAVDCERADEVVSEAAERGLLLLRTHRQTVKVAPPLCISERDLRRGLAILKRLL